MGKIIRGSNPKKGYSYDMVSIRMRNISGDSIYKPLGLMLRPCLDHKTFPRNCKKLNVVLIHKKNDKQSIKNYRSVSFLPVYGKVFEKLLYNNMFSYFIKNDLISKINLGSNQGIPALTNFFQLPIKSISPLMMARK